MITQIAAKGRPREDPKSRLGLGEDGHITMNCVSTAVGLLLVAQPAMAQKVSMVFGCVHYFIAIESPYHIPDIATGLLT